MGQGDPLAITLRNLVQSDPVTRLKAVVAMREQIELLQAELVGQVLRRENAPTWEEIGKLLGMSKNTAIKRYGHRAPETKKRRTKKRIEVKLSPERPRRKAVDRLAEGGGFPQGTAAREPVPGYTVAPEDLAWLEQHPRGALILEHADSTLTALHADGTLLQLRSDEAPRDHVALGHVPVSEIRREERPGLWPSELFPSQEGDG